MKVTVRTGSGRTIELDDEVLDPSEVRGGALPRVCFAAAHVVVRDDYVDVPHTVEAPGTADELSAAVDWEATMSIRKRHDAVGMGIAEAMDTAQRFEFGWTGARELMRRCAGLGLHHGFVGGAGTDHVASIRSVDDLVEAWSEQVRFVADLQGVPILLPQPWLTESGADEACFVEVYKRVIDATEGPVLLHWLGEAFHPAMRGYFPGDSVRRILAHAPDRIRGIKLSLLDRDYEERLREDLLPRDQVVLTGDDHNFSALLEGTDQAARPLPPLGRTPMSAGHFSHALLGVFDACARPASAALRRLGRGDQEGYRALMEPCEAMGRTIFEPPTQRYKSGVAFLAWLRGHQTNPMLLNHEEQLRDTDHYLRVTELASRAGVIEDAASAADRLERWLEGRSDA